MIDAPRNNIVTTQDYVKEGFAKIDRDLAFLMECFQEVLQEIGEMQIASRLPFIAVGKAARRHPRFSHSLGQAYSIAFQLLNMVEENTAAQMRRARASGSTAHPEPGLWLHYLNRLKQQGLKEPDICEQLARVRIEPVLTAHPTEAKRSTVLEQHRALYILLVLRENQMWTPDELNANRNEIKALLERLWRTGEVLLEKPSVAKERQTILYYLREIFPAVLPRLDTQLQQAWAHAGFDPDRLDDPENRPRICFGTWVGGDRDGHPFVTADVTAQTLNELRVQSLLVLHRHLSALPRTLSLSGERNSCPPRLLEGIRRLASTLGDRGDAAVARNPQEPWRQFSNLILERLPIQPTTTREGKLADWPGAYQTPRELSEDLLLLRDSLVESGARRLAEQDINPILRAVQVFGFHLATLDVRQNSAFHDKAMAQLMTAAGLDGGEFSDWPESERIQFLTRELRSPRPFLHSSSPVGPQADAVLSCYRVLAAHIEKYGNSGVGSLIVSMTRRVSDLLTVYVLAREAGLARYTPQGLHCLVPVVPLFETLEDLQGSAGIMEAFLNHPVTRLSLKKIRQRQSEEVYFSTGFSGPPVQQIMIGYSDSNKDAGILASQWMLHKTQKQLVQVGDAADVHIRFFHGRGGTISRGAGPTHRFLEALPRHALGGDLRVTEQGETIAQKYANLITATYNLELLIAGSAATLLGNRAAAREEELFAASTEKLSALSARYYRELLHSEGFLEFFAKATPIDVLENSRIGSRPSRRTGSRTLDDLRAIPWVFSWTQSRYYLPGWFGAGSALEQLAESAPAEFQALRQAIAKWPFLRYVMTNIETNLASTDLDIMSRYAALVTNSRVRNKFFLIIEAEYERTHRMLDKVFGGGSMKARRPRMVATLQLRETALRTLHLQQIDLLKRWRRLRDNNQTAQANELLQDLLLSVNAIASGLRTTG